MGLLSIGNLVFEIFKRGSIKYIQYTFLKDAKLYYLKINNGSPKFGFFT